MYSRSHRFTSKSRSPRSRSRSKSPSLSAYYTPRTSPFPSPIYRTSPSPYIKTRFPTPTESMEKKFYDLLEEQKKKHIETNSAKNRRQLSQKMKDERQQQRLEMNRISYNNYLQQQAQKKKDKNRSTLKRAAKKIGEIGFAFKDRSRRWFGGKQNTKKNHK